MRLSEIEVGQTYRLHDAPTDQERTVWDIPLGKPASVNQLLGLTSSLSSRASATVVAVGVPYKKGSQGVLCRAIRLVDVVHDCPDCRKEHHTGETLDQEIEFTVHSSTIMSYAADLEHDLWVMRLKDKFEQHKRDRFVREMNQRMNQD